MRIVQANFYYKNPKPVSACNKLKSFKPHSIGLQEAFTKHGLIRTQMTPEYRFFDARAGGGKGAEEIPIMRRKDTVGNGHGGYRASLRDRPDNTGIGQERWLNWVRYTWNGKKYCHINCHPSAAVESDSGYRLSIQIKRVFEYRRYMINLEKEIKRQKRLGFIVIVTGDMNFSSRRRTRLWYYSPLALFRRNGMAFVNRGLDWVAWDKSKAAKVHHDFIPPRETGSDHWWIVVDLKPV